MIIDVNNQNAIFAKLPYLPNLKTMNKRGTPQLSHSLLKILKLIEIFDKRTLQSLSHPVQLIR